MASRLMEPLIRNCDSTIANWTQGIVPINTGVVTDEDLALQMSFEEEDDVGSTFLDALRGINKGVPESGPKEASIGSKILSGGLRKTSPKAPADEKDDAKEPDDTSTDKPIRDVKLEDAETDSGPVDLNDEDALVRDGLEDRGLLVHMQEARGKLADLEEKRKDIPDEDELRKKHIQNLRLVSSCVSDLTRRLGEYQTTIENTLVQSSNADKLATGRQPHAYPKVKGEKPDNADALVHMSKKLAENGQAHQTLHEMFSGVLKSLIVLRREYESVVDGYGKIAEHAMKYREAARTLGGEDGAAH
jgi:hypothetical protein